MLVVRIQERTPVAILAGVESSAVDGEGVVLPIRLQEAPVDLPVLFQSEGVANGQLGAARDRLATEVLGRIQELAPDLFSKIDACSAVRDGVRLHVVGIPQEILVGPVGVGSLERRINAVRSLMETHRLGVEREIDLRFLGQAVVRDRER